MLAENAELFSNRIARTHRTQTVAAQREGISCGAPATGGLMDEITESEAGLSPALRPYPAKKRASLTSASVSIRQ